MCQRRHEPTTHCPYGVSFLPSPSRTIRIAASSSWRTALIVAPKIRSFDSAVAVGAHYQEVRMDGFGQPDDFGSRCI